MNGFEKSVRGNKNNETVTRTSGEDKKKIGAMVLIRPADTTKNINMRLNGLEGRLCA